MDTEARKRSDDVFKFIIEKAASSKGYKAIRADHIEKSGIITTQIIQNLLNSDILIADLSEKNPNVLYELAVRHATRKPFIQIITSGQAIPFDVAANRTIHYDLSLAGAEEAIRQIEAQIQSFENGEVDSENPIANAIDLNRLRLSSDSNERTMAKLLDSINNIGSAVSRLEQSKESQARTDKMRDLAARYKTLLDQSNSELSRLRILKDKVDFSSLRDESDLYDALSHIQSVLMTIKNDCVPEFSGPEHRRENVEESLNSIIRAIEHIQGDLIPF